MTRRYDISAPLRSLLGRKLGRKTPLPGICAAWCTVVQFCGPMTPNTEWLVAPVYRRTAVTREYRPQDGAGSAVLQIQVLACS